MQLMMPMPYTYSFRMWESNPFIPKVIKNYDYIGCFSECIEVIVRDNMGVE
jgi:hypothetical protein